MNLTRRFVALLAVVAVLTPLAAGCGSHTAPVAAPSPTSTPSPLPLPTATTPPSPEKGTCYDLSYAEAVAPTGNDRPRSCTKPHTAETYAVGTIDNLVDGHLLAVDSDHVQSAVAQTCPERLAGFVGGTEEQRRLSMVKAVWFTPTVAQSDAGADWYRCDAVVSSGSEQLADVDSRLAGVLDSTAGRDRYAMCGTAEPGTSGFERVLCTAKHSWKAIAVVTFPAGPYPGDQAAKARGRTQCEEAGRAAATDPLSFTWSYEFPTRDDWASGQRFGRCWAPG